MPSYYAISISCNKYKWHKFYLIHLSMISCSNIRMYNIIIIMFRCWVYQFEVELKPCLAEFFRHIANLITCLNMYVRIVIFLLTHCSTLLRFLPILHEIYNCYWNLKVGINLYLFCLGTIVSNCLLIMRCYRVKWSKLNWIRLML